jgi:hypothetical protein
LNETILRNHLWNKLVFSNQRKLFFSFTIFIYFLLSKSN